MATDITTQTAEPSRATPHSLVRALVPKAWRLRHHRRREEKLIEGWFRTWRSLCAAPAPADAPLSNDCLLIPSDTRTFTGGKGDEAMTVTILAALRAAGHEGRIFALCETDAASEAATDSGFEPFRIPQDDRYIRAFDEWLAQHRPSVAIGMGADSIDGAYGVVGPAGLLAVLDLAARRGSKTLVTGFSVRSKPAEALAPFFQAMRSEVRLNVRDPISLHRLREAYGRDGELVADTAFLLEPRLSDAVTALGTWVDGRRAAGRTVIGLNVHPMLFSPEDTGAREAFLDRLAPAILAVSARRPVAWALVAHDFRPGDADSIMLDPLAVRLAALGDDLRAEYGVALSANELKGIGALFDGVVSARMHFAIASLGSGVPVLGVVYQGKFEGLFQHLGLEEDLLCRPDASEEKLTASLLRFLEALPTLRSDVEERRHDLRTLARRNFEPLEPGYRSTTTSEQALVVS